LLFLALTEKTVKHLDFDELVVAKLYGRRVATYQIKMPVSLKKSFLSNSSPYREKRVSSLQIHHKLGSAHEKWLRARFEMGLFEL
jgi:hypothetical protein